VLPILALITGLVAGTLVAGLTLSIIARRMRSSMVREVTRRVGPVLERRAHALGIEMRNTPEVNVGNDGELEITRDEDELGRLLRVADSIDQHEHAQLGFVDTIRVSKEEVDKHIDESKAKARKSSA
jgi:hypothetical protein